MSTARMIVVSLEWSPILGADAPAQADGSPGLSGKEWAFG
jgi:hypothetical protein